MRRLIYRRFGARAAVIVSIPWSLVRFTLLTFCAWLFATALIASPVGPFALHAHEVRYRVPVANLRRADGSPYRWWLATGTLPPIAGGGVSPALPAAKDPGPGFFTDAMTILGRVRARVYDLKDYQATGDGIANDTTAVANWAAAAIGAGDPTAVARKATGILFAPAGDYLVSSPEVLRSVRGITMLGAGKFATRFLGTGTLSSVFDLDGVSYSKFEDFAVAGTGTHSITTAIRWRWGSGTAASSAHTTFTGIRIADGTFVNGFNVEGSNDVSHGRWYDCDVDLSWSPGNTTTAQTCWKFGDGSQANNLDHSLTGCSINGANDGVWASGTNVTCTNVEGGRNGCDFRFITPASGACKIDGWRSEGSQRLISVSSGAVSFARQIEVRGVEFHAQEIPDGKVMEFACSGSVLLDNVKIVHAAESPYGGNPYVHLNAGGGFMSLSARGLMMETPFGIGAGKAFDQSDSPYNVSFDIVNYLELDPSVTNTVVKLTPAFRGFEAANGSGAAFEFASHLGGVLVPRMDTTQRNALTTPSDGLVIYNTTTGKFEGRSGGAWAALN